LLATNVRQHDIKKLGWQLLAAVLPLQQSKDTYMTGRNGCFSATDSCYIVIENKTSAKNLQSILSNINQTIYIIVVIIINVIIYTTFILRRKNII